MNYYITFGDFQKYLIEHFELTGKPMEPPKMLAKLLDEGKSKER